MGWNGDVETLSGLRAGADHALRPRDRTRGGDAGDRAQELDQRGQVVRPEVEERAGACLEEEGRVRVPVLRARRLEQGQTGDGPPDRAVVHASEARLERGAEPG